MKEKIRFATSNILKPRASGLNRISMNIELIQHLLTLKNIHNVLKRLLFFEQPLILVYLDP